VARNQFASDASIYRIEPLAVVFPRDADDVVATLRVAAEHDVPVLPRGAGTSLAGQTVAAAVVLDFSRHMFALVDVDVEARTARVQPGLVQDDLNRAVARHGLMFAPDTSTANRATLGGMIGNNSCGMRSARYGMTIDHVAWLDVVLADGSRAHLAPTQDHEVATRARGTTREAALYREVPALISRHDAAIRRDIPAFWRRSGGYRLERLLPDRGPFNLAHLVVGSEGTLAVVTEATVRLVPTPKHVVAVAGHFRSVSGAIAATPDAQACDAAAIELVDHFILDLSRRSPVHREVVSFLDGAPGALLFVEFHGDTAAEATAQADRLAALWRAHGHGYAAIRADSADQLRRFRDLRASGQGLLLAAGQGGKRSIAFVEDTAVDPSRLVEYCERFSAILRAHSLEAGFYGHASAGCMHVRPFMDLSRPAEVATMRAVAEEVLALVTEFGGNNSSEHGDGLVRSEFNARVFGGEVYGVMRRVKGLFDPHNRLNPGKKVDAPSMTGHLRDAARFEPTALRTHFASLSDGGMYANANGCARIGQCRKSPGAGATMCPSYMATRDEQHATRGRAMALAEALRAPDPRVALGDQRLRESLDLCLECKACAVECPLGVDMATLKSEVLAQVQAMEGTSWRTRFFGHARTLNAIGSAVAPVANAIARWSPVRALLEQALGIDRRRPLPVFAPETLSQWFRQRATTLQRGAPAGTVVFFADSFTNYTEPAIGRAAIELLELAGHDVTLVDDVCCGRSLISKGMLTDARERHVALAARLVPFARAGVPIVGVEPSCLFTLREELVTLGAAPHEAPAIAAHVRLVESLLVEAIDAGRLSLVSVHPRHVLFHPHCHQKAASAVAPTTALLQRVVGARVEVLDAGCCGMAGSFGFEHEHYDVSMQVGELRLLPAVRGAADAVITATGVSCRQQVAHGTGRDAIHPLTFARTCVAS
jgi:FAD/FMN-containing dehydrogenase/Fe-S oxidoreductase